jgi:hypothetical protein
MQDSYVGGLGLEAAVLPRQLGYRLLQLFPLALLRLHAKPNLRSDSSSKLWCSKMYE